MNLWWCWKSNVWIDKVNGKVIRVELRTLSNLIPHILAHLGRHVVVFLDDPSSCEVQRHLLASVAPRCVTLRSYFGLFSTQRTTLFGRQPLVAVGRKVVRLIVNHMSSLSTAHIITTQVSKYVSMLINL